MTCRGNLLRILAALLIICPVLAGNDRQEARADKGVSRRVIVRVQPGVDAHVLASNYGATVRDSVPNSDLYCLTPPGSQNDLTFAKRLSGDPRVVYAEQDSYINSPEANGNPFHFAFDKSANPKTYNFSSQGVGTGGAINKGVYGQINLGKSLTMATGSGIIVAVLDTGATFNHPALMGHYLTGYNTLQPTSPPNDLPDGTTNKGVGHGTMIAGLIARIAPDARILPIRVLNGDGVGSVFNIARGVDYAVAHGARIITMSFGAPKSSGALNDALDAADAAGVILVASAGNDNANRPQIPAQGHGALAVGSVESNSVKSFYTNYGSFVRVVAPGTGIRSTYWDGGYATWSGTSFSTPLVAAEAALMLSVQSGLTSEDIISLIRKTARSVDAINPGYKGQLGKGLIDVEAAVIAAKPK